MQAVLGTWGILKTHSPETNPIGLVLQSVIANAPENRWTMDPWLPWLVEPPIEDWWLDVSVSQEGNQVCGFPSHGQKMNPKKLDDHDPDSCTSYSSLHWQMVPYDCSSQKLLKLLTQKTAVEMAWFPVQILEKCPAIWASKGTPWYPILRCHIHSNLWEESTPHSWRMGANLTFIWICSRISSPIYG